MPRIFDLLPRLPISSIGTVSEETLQQLTAELEELNRRKEERRRLRRQLENVEEELAGARSEKAHYYGKIRDEEQDVEALEGITLTSFYHSIIGDKVREIDEEKKHVARARTAYEEAKAAVKDLKEEKERYETQLEELQNLEEVYESTMEEKEQLLKQLDRPATDRLRDISEELGRIRGQIDEVDDAIHAGSTLRSYATRIKHLITSARRTRYRDRHGISFRNPRHRKMRKARRLNRNKHFYGRKYKRELDDLQNIGFSLPGDFSVAEEGVLERALDFGELFGAWQSSSEQQSGAYVRQLQSQISELNTLKDELKQKIHELEDERDELIRNA